MRPNAFRFHRRGGNVVTHEGGRQIVAGERPRQRHRNLPIEADPRRVNGPDGEATLEIDLRREWQRRTDDRGRRFRDLDGGRESNRRQRPFLPRDMRQTRNPDAAEERKKDHVKPHGEHQSPLDRPLIPSVAM
jgi:hypothetical protein